MQRNKSDAERFVELDDQTQNDLRHDAWNSAVEQFRATHPDWYDELESSSYCSWDDMRLEVYGDENDRQYFHIVTGVQHAPNHENGERRFGMAHEFMKVYRHELKERVP